MPELSDEERRRLWQDEVLSALLLIHDEAGAVQRDRNRADWNRRFHEHLKCIDGEVTLIAFCAVVTTLAILYAVFR